MKLATPQRAARAALGKKATDVVILDLRKVTEFTDYFVLASAANQRQLLAVADAVMEAMREQGLRPSHIEGYPKQEWILLDYGDFVFHVARGGLKRGEESIKLTARERELRRHFAQRPGTPVARHELAADDSSGTERAIDVQINRLRRKIESDPANPVYLQTVRGKGYILYTD